MYRVTTWLSWKPTFAGKPNKRPSVSIEKALGDFKYFVLANNGFELCEEESMGIIGDSYAQFTFYSRNVVEDGKIVKPAERAIIEVKKIKNRS